MNSGGGRCVNPYHSTINASTNPANGPGDTNIEVLLTAVNEIFDADKRAQRPNALPDTQPEWNIKRQRYANTVGAGHKVMPEFMDSQDRQKRHRELEACYKLGPAEGFHALKRNK